MVCTLCLHNVCGRPTSIFYSAFKELSSSLTRDTPNNGVKIAQKVGEEAVELVIESKDDNKENFLGEAADLRYHYLILLQAKNYKLQDVINVLAQRHK